MLAGTYEVALDKAGRLTVPSRFRDELGDGELMLVMSLEKEHRHVMLFGEGKFEPWLDQVVPQRNALGLFANFDRTVMARSFPSNFDSAGRILVPKRAREWASLSGTCMVLGVTNRVEIWDPAGFEAWEMESSDGPVVGLSEDEMAGLLQMQLQKLQGQR